VECLNPPPLAIGTSPTTGTNSRWRVGDWQVVPAAARPGAIFSDDGGRCRPGEGAQGERPDYTCFVRRLVDGRGTVQVRSLHGQVTHIPPQAGLLIVMRSG
jgi:hypothetical protein